MSLKSLFHVQYRLTVQYKGDNRPRSTFTSSRRFLRDHIRDIHGCYLYWSLYKTGPFNLPERLIDSDIADQKPSNQ